MVFSIVKKQRDIRKDVSFFWAKKEERAKKIEIIFRAKK
jgi:hypothetical protein